MSDTPVVVGAGATHEGRRKHNEDNFFIDNELGLFVVADGVGGQDAGEIASDIVCTTIGDSVRQGDGLHDAILKANQAIADAIARGHGRPGMASTIVVLRAKGELYELAWLGDSRVYLWDGKLKLLSRDHSLVESLLATGEISLDEAQSHPKKNVILAALGGGDANINVGQNGGLLRKGARFLLCSDGVSDVLSPASIAQWLDCGESESDIARGLVQAAVDSQGKDNITAVVVGVHESAYDLTANDEHVEVVRTFDPETGEHEYHRKERVQTSGKVKKLQPLFPNDEGVTEFKSSHAVQSHVVDTHEVEPTVADTGFDSRWVSIRNRTGLVILIIIAALGLVLLL